jgi:hypothetical protein
MPLVDGVLSTKMIRHYEKEVEELRRIRPRVPIIAVSASLTENSRFDYVQTGYVIYFLFQYGQAANSLVTVLMPGS